MTSFVSAIRERYLHTLERIAQAARLVGREPQAVRLVVVTKSQPLEVVEAAIQAGVQHLGENYPEEAVEKIARLSGYSGVEWHMIGHVQSRKARLVVDHFDWLHSLDSLKLAERLNRFCAERNRVLPVLLEFNVGGEESKFGWPAWEENQWESLTTDISRLLQLQNLRICGLMAMPPLGERGEDSRPYFQKLRRLRDFLAGCFPQVTWTELSMGTSADFEVAVQEGATLVRVGTAILGPRPYQKEK
ncbi:MAG: YggS family pyridoxal phosphate-dependent enzyme [Anaerolineae bacterium]